MLRGGKAARFSSFESPKVIAKYPYLEAVKNSLPLGRCRPNIPEYPAISEIFSTTLHKILTGEISPANIDEAMHDAAEAGNKILIEVYG